MKGRQENTTGDIGELKAEIQVLAGNLYVFYNSKKMPYLTYLFFQSVKGLLLSSRSFPQQPPVSAPPSLPAWQLQQNETTVNTLLKSFSNIVSVTPINTCRPQTSWQQHRQKVKDPQKQAQQMQVHPQAQPMQAQPVRLRCSAQTQGKSSVERKDNKRLSSETVFLEIISLFKV